MRKNQVRIFELDGDAVEVPLVYDDEIGGYIHEYPDFKESPRITPLGRRWVNVINNDCPHADDEYGDCGSCKFFLCENAGDCIGICTHEEFTERKDKEA